MSEIISVNSCTHTEHTHISSSPCRSRIGKKVRTFHILTLFDDHLQMHHLNYSANVLSLTRTHTRTHICSSIYETWAQVSKDTKMMMIWKRKWNDKKTRKDEIRYYMHSVCTTYARHTAKFHENKEPTNDERFVTTSFRNENLLL